MTRGGVVDQRVGGVAAAARGRRVDDVVVDQRGGVQQLDRGGERHQQVEVVAAELAGEQRDGGTHALAAGGEDVVEDVREEGEVGGTQRLQQVVDAGDVSLHRAVQAVEVAP